jgi:dephospho-CoA kinase
MPAAGKNIARDYAQAKGIPYFATGDMVRAEVARRGGGDAGRTAEISTELRGADGMGVTRLALATALAAGQPLVFLEGMRSWPEIELIRNQVDCRVVAFLAPRALRRERIARRGRQDDDPAAFDARDRRELDYGVAIPVALADAYILNTGTMAEAMEALDRMVAAGGAA